MSIEEDIKAVEDEIRKTPYNKATQLHIGRLKAKLARLKDEAQKPSGKGGGSGYCIKKSGDATIILVGFPSVGKSTLLNKLTNAQSPVADYDFTTLKVIPGAFVHRGARVQLLDVPGLIEGAATGKGRGKEVLSVIRNADLLLLIIDVFHLGQLDVIKKELYDAGVRINQKPPAVIIHRKNTGGITINRTVECKIDDAMIRSVLSEYKIHNADVLIRESITLDHFIDSILGNRKYVPALTLVNKADLMDDETLKSLTVLERAILISAENGWGLDKLKDAIFDTLQFIRIYMKRPGSPPDKDKPLILKEGATISEVCDHIHRDLRRKFRYALIWGKSVKHEGQRVGLEHVLLDEDAVTLVTER